MSWRDDRRGLLVGVLVLIAAIALLVVSALVHAWVFGYIAEAVRT